jgi:phosphate transport system substrate-binding protein
MNLLRRSCSLVTVLVVLAAPVTRAELRLAGSDLMGAEFRAAVERFAQGQARVVRLEWAGSRLAREELTSGRATAALLVSPEAEPAWPADWLVLPLAYHVLVVVAAPKAPVNQIDLGQVREIFSAGTTTLTRWGDLGAPGAWRGRQVQPVVVGDRAGLAHDLLQQRVLRGGPMKNTVAVLENIREVATRVRQSPGGLGVLPAAPDDLKVLALAAAPGGVAFGPTPENVHAGDYPLRVPVRLVFPRAAVSEHLALGRFLLGDEVAAALRQDGLVPLPRPVRQQLAFDLEAW